VGSADSRADAGRVSLDELRCPYPLLLHTSTGGSSLLVPIGGDMALISPTQINQLTPLLKHQPNIFIGIVFFQSMIICS